MAAVRRVVGATPLIYTGSGQKKNEAREAEVADWLKRLKRGREKRVLITDGELSRGWETSAAMAVGLKAENLVMRACGFCFLIRRA